MKKTGFTVWFTGLPFSGKKQLAALLSTKLKSRGYKTKILDGGRIRREFNRKLGYSRDDVFQNIRRIAFVCHLLSRNNVGAIAAAISPYRAIRDEARERIGDFVEVHVDAPLDVCEQRDVKGLYAKARRGEIKQFTGIDDPYEAPEAPEVICHTAEETPQQSAAKVLQKVEDLGYLDGAG